MGETGGAVWEIVPVPRDPVSGYAQCLRHRYAYRLYAMLDLSNFEELIVRLAAIDFSQSSEQATREMAVNPVIGALGWDTFNPDEVSREHSVLGGRVDYCLRGQMRNVVLIEVKRAGTDLGEHQEQLLRYAFDEGVPLAALTDGLVWWLYLPMAGGRWEQRRFSRTNLRAQRAATATSALHRFLNRDGLIGGEALEEAKREFESQERDRPRARSATGGLAASARRSAGPFARPARRDGERDIWPSPRPRNDH